MCSSVEIEHLPTTRGYRAKAGRGIRLRPGRGTRRPSTCDASGIQGARGRGTARLYDLRMTLSVVAPPLAEAADPTWYLVLDVVGTWVGAIATSIAAWVALWLGLRSLGEQRALQLERERTQADRVTLVRRAPPGEKPFLTLHNESDRLISAVRVVALGSSRSEVRDIDLIPAGKGVDIGLTGLTNIRNVAVVEFDDAAGRTWVRTSQGMLRRAHRQKNNTSLHLRYRTAGEPKGELGSVTVALQRGAMLLAFQLKEEPDPHTSPTPRARLKFEIPRGMWARRNKQ